MLEAEEGDDDDDGMGGDEVGVATRNGMRVVFEKEIALFDCFYIDRMRSGCQDTAYSFQLTRVDDDEQCLASSFTLFAKGIRHCFFT